MKMKNKALFVFCLSLCLAVLFSFGAFAVEFGDVNADGRVTADDARLALRYSVSLEKLSEEAAFRADVDSDGGVFASDARTILRIAVGLSPSRVIRNEYEMLRSGVFTYKGERLETESGKYEYFELSKTPDSVHLLTNFEGVNLAMFIKNGNVYMVSHEKKAYLVTPDEIFATLKIDKNSLLKGYNESSVYPPLEEAYSVTSGKVEGYNCKIYRISEGSVITEVSLCGNRLIRIREFDQRGILTGDIKFIDISMSVPEREKNIPSHYKKYEGKAEALIFVGKLLGK